MSRSVGDVFSNIIIQFEVRKRRILEKKNSSIVLYKALCKTLGKLYKTIEKNWSFSLVILVRKNRTFHPENTFLISKSYSEHVSSVEECRRCVFDR